MEIKIATVKYQNEGSGLARDLVRAGHKRLQEYLSEHSFSRFATLRESDFDEMKSYEMVCGLLVTGVLSEDCLVESLLTWDVLHTIKIAGRPERVDIVKKEIVGLYSNTFTDYYGEWTEKACEVDYDWSKHRFVSDLEIELSKVVAV